MKGGSCFDHYCEVCGLPFYDIKHKNIRQDVSWMNNAILKFRGIEIQLYKDNCNLFDIKSKDIPLALKKDEDFMDFVGGNKLETFAFGPYGDYGDESSLYHNVCKDRPDIYKVKEVLPIVKKYQEQYFDIDNFIKDPKVKWLLNGVSKPSTSKRKTPSPKPVTSVKREPTLKETPEKQHKIQMTLKEAQATLRRAKEAENAAKLTLKNAIAREKEAKEFLKSECIKKAKALYKQCMKN